MLKMVQIPIVRDTFLQKNIYFLFIDIKWPPKSPGHLKICHSPNPSYMQLWYISKTVLLLTLFLDLYIRALKATSRPLEVGGSFIYFLKKILWDSKFFKIKIHKNGLLIRISLFYYFFIFIALVRKNHILSTIRQQYVFPAAMIIGCSLLVLANTNRTYWSAH